MNRAIAVLGTLLCLVCVGCGESGPPLGSVEGTVSMDGKPLPNVLVTFSPTAEGGAPSTGVTDGEGHYVLLYTDRRGALVGKHKVSVTTIKQAPAAAASLTSISADSPEYAKQAAGGTPADYAAAAAENKEPIPARYNSQSQLEEVVESGSNTIDIKLTSEKS
jgi:hypothetical protein